jgi:ribonuclease-3
MDFSNYQQFAQETLSVTFHNIQLLVTAFTHRSYLNEHRKTVAEHNERLEFLGDAVLELVSTEYLFNNYEEPEGILTNWRSSLVRTESIGAAAAKLGFEKMLRLSRGEKHGTDRAREQILANSFEAVIGAMYLDQGYEACKKFITDNLLVTFKQILASGSWMDPKSHFQEMAQSRDGLTPNYRVLEEAGPDHDKTFTVGVFVGDKLIAKGTGTSKQAGQQQAAESALAAYTKNQ